MSILNLYFIVLSICLFLKLIVMFFNELLNSICWCFCWWEVRIVKGDLWKTFDDLIRLVMVLRHCTYPSNLWFTLSSFLYSLVNCQVITAADPSMAGDMATAVTHRPVYLTPTRSDWRLRRQDTFVTQHDQIDCCIKICRFLPGTDEAIFDMVKILGGWKLNGRAIGDGVFLQRATGSPQVVRALILVF